MELDQEVKGPERVEVWVEAAKAVAEVAKVEAVVLPQVRAVIAYVPIVVKKRHIKRGALVMSRNALSAERL